MSSPETFLVLAGVRRSDDSLAEQLLGCRYLVRLAGGDISDEMGIPETLTAVQEAIEVTKDGCRKLERVIGLLQFKKRLDVSARTTVR